MAYLVHRESGNSIQLGDEPLIVDKEWLVKLGKRTKGVRELHARILGMGDHFILEPGSDSETYCNIVKVTERVRLNHNDVLVFGKKHGGALFVFKDEVQRQKRLDTRRIKFSYVDHSKLKNAAEKMSRAFFESVPCSLKEFCRYLLTFMIDKFRVNRGVVFRVELSPDGKSSKWHAIVSRAMKPFDPPRAIIEAIEPASPYTRTVTFSF